MKRVEKDDSGFLVRCSRTGEIFLRGATEEQVIGYFCRVVTDRAVDAARRMCKEALQLGVH